MEESSFASIGVYKLDKPRLERLQEQYAKEHGLRRKPSYAQVIQWLIDEYEVAHAVKIK